MRGRRVACAAQARAAVLLEVLVSLGLLVFGLAVVGLQVNMGLQAALAAERGTKAVLLADTKMAELLSGVVVPETNNDEIEGDFGMVYPGFTWRFRFQPTDVPDFLMVTLEIGYSEAQAKAQALQPDQDLDFDDEDVRVVETTYRLLPIPADVNLQRDFGLTQEELDKLNEAASGQGVGSGGAAEAAMEGAADAGAGAGDLADILAMLGPLLSGNFDPRMLASLPQDQLAQIQPLLEMMLGRSNVGARAPSILGGGRSGMSRGGRRGGRDRDGDRNGSEARGSDRDSGRDDSADDRGGRGRDDDGGDRGGRGRDRNDDRGERDGANDSRGSNRRDGDDGRSGRDDDQNESRSNQGRNGSSRGSNRTPSR